ncbi:hypothetical protein [Haloarcula sebkhae]|uniref:Uncharacterized protein n=2 Tax=Haloarcula sebkhae TaxID=932660 RepID=A0ACC6VHY4_9EURY|nr:hypothetical protein [Haloarcula sebkhae]GGK56637.1 hypothetical protein GCM10009067_06360 [Haloarcula sebkhae]
MAEDERPDFDYSGRLVFNGLRRTVVNHDDPEDMREELLSDLREFSRGNPHDEKKGFRDLDLSSLVNGQGYVLESDLENLASDLIDKEYVWENYEGSENREFVDNDGNTTSAWLRNTSNAYVYWDFPDYLLVQGSKDKVEKTLSRVNSSLGEEVKTEELDFDSDFFLWLVYRYVDDEVNVPGPISVRRLESSEVMGDQDDYGHRGRVEDSQNIAKSLPIIVAILQEMDFQMIEGMFKVNGYDVTAEIKTSGRIHVKVAGDVDNAETQLKRALIALFFVDEFVGLYTKWEQMDDTEKYPPFSFFDDLIGAASENNVELEFDLDDLIEDYEDKRGEDAEPSDFDNA